MDYKVLAGISPKARERTKIAKTLSTIEYDEFCIKLAVTGGNVSYGSRSYNGESDITNKNMPRAGTRITTLEDLNIKMKSEYPRTIRCRSSRSSFKKQKGQNLHKDKVHKRLGSQSTKSMNKNSDILTDMFTSPNQFMPNPKSASTRKRTIKKTIRSKKVKNSPTGQRPKTTKVHFADTVDMVWEFEYDKVDDDNQENIHRLDDGYDDNYENVPEWDLSHDDIKIESESDVEQCKQYEQVDAMQLLQKQIMYETKRNELLNIGLANDNLEIECEKNQTKNVVENVVENELSDYVNYRLTYLNKLRQVDPLT